MTDAAAASEGMSDPSEELRAAMALSRVRDLGPLRIRWMIDREGSARAALEAFRRGAWFRAGEDGSRAVRSPRGKLVARLRRLQPVAVEELERLAERGTHVVAYRGPGYPARLAHLPDPPTVLYLRGRGPLPVAGAVTMVGTRAATQYGRRMARDLAAGFARHGCCVVSGMAVGIDAAAHLGALDAGGTTVGVLGWGLDHPEPRDRTPLFSEVSRRGLLAAELAPQVPPSRGTFPRRNRILAALSDAVVVVQAGRRSGALITARHGLEIGRDVFAVPGPVGPPASEGVHKLLLDGAGPATRAEDVLSAVGLWSAGAGEGAGGESEGSEAPAEGGASTAPPEFPARTVLRFLDAHGPAGADVLAARAGVPPSKMLVLLLRLELAGEIEVLAGGRYARLRVREVAGGAGDRAGGRR